MNTLSCYNVNKVFVITLLEDTANSPHMFCLHTRHLLTETQRQMWAANAKYEHVHKQNVRRRNSQWGSASTEYSATNMK